MLTLSYQGASPQSSPNAPDVLAGKPVVFLGKESSAGCKTTDISDLYPFGCQTLKRLSAHFASGSTTPEDGLVGEQVEVTTGVNVRKGLPQSTTRGAVYGCKTEVLLRGAKVKLLSTVALKYAGDTFYWGEIDRPALDCGQATAPLPRAAD